MLSLCLSTTPFSSSCPPSSSDSHSECHSSSAPLPIGAHLEENGLLRSTSSSLSSSLDSISSVRSGFSSRSAAEREQERRERRRLLDLSIAKIQGANVPLRKHLLVYNTAKAFQKDLDALDEEDLYATLMEPLHATVEVDNWAVFSEESSLKRQVCKGGRAVSESVQEEPMEVDQHHQSTNIWQWMASSEQLEMHTTLSQDQERWCSFSAATEESSSSVVSQCGRGPNTWSLFSGMASTWSSPLDDSSFARDYLPTPSCSSSSFFAFESDETSFGDDDDFSRVWGELTPLSSRDLLHLLPIEA